MLRSLVHRLPVMVVPKWLDTRTQPIAIDDVTRTLAALADLPDPPAEVQLGGADVLSYREMMERYAHVSGQRKPLVVRVPVLSPRLSSYWVGLVTPVEMGLVQAAHRRHDLRDGGPGAPAAGPQRRPARFRRRGPTRPRPDVASALCAPWQPSPPSSPQLAGPVRRCPAAAQPAQARRRGGHRRSRGPHARRRRGRRALDPGRGPDAAGRGRRRDLGPPPPRAPRADVLAVPHARDARHRAREVHGDRPLRRRADQAVHAPELPRPRVRDERRRGHRPLAHPQGPARRAGRARGRRLPRDRGAALRARRQRPDARSTSASRSRTSIRGSRPGSRSGSTARPSRASTSSSRTASCGRSRAWTWPSRACAASRRGPWTTCPTPSARRTASRRAYAGLVGQP